MKLKLYKCRVNVGRDVAQHEVPKDKITEREVKLLRQIHGNDMIKGLVQIGELECNEMEELNRLAYIYGPRRVERCFNIQLDDFESWVSDQEAVAQAEGAGIDTVRKMRGTEIAIDMRDRIDVGQDTTLHVPKKAAEARA